MFFMECALFRKDYDISFRQAWEESLHSYLFMECALFRKDYDLFFLFFLKVQYLLYGMCLV